jgi:catechol 2,3-dioxygenase-like lactoylglutathione lyase family enzyme
MSRLLGNPAHQCYVYPDFDKAIERFAAAGIGPFFKLDETAGMSDYRGEQHMMSITVALLYSGDSCIEIIAPKPGYVSAYNEFLDRHPGGGLHHIAYYSADFDKTLAMMRDAGKPLNVVVDMRDPSTGKSIEIYCEPVGDDDPVLIQLMLPGLLDPWFEMMREVAANWDGTEPVRDASPSMYAAMAAYAERVDA